MRYFYYLIIYQASRFAMKNEVACGWSDPICIREGVCHFSRQTNSVFADKNLSYIVLPVRSVYLLR